MPCAAGEVSDPSQCVPEARGRGQWGGRTGDAYVDAGVYAESVILKGAHDGEELTGRCREMVTLDGGQADQPGIAVERSGTSVSIADLTVSDGYFGLTAVMTTGMVRRSDFAANRGAGVIVSGAGASLDLTDTIVRDSTPLQRAKGRLMKAA